MKEVRLRKIISEELSQTLSHKIRSSSETTANCLNLHKNTVRQCRLVGSDDLLTSSSEPTKLCSCNLFLFAIIAIFSACSNDLYIETAPHPISVNAAFYRDNDTLKTPRLADTISTETALVFFAKITPTPSALQNYFWTIGTQKYPNLQRKIIFDSVGFYPAKFYAVDVLGDTLVTEMSVRVSKKPTCENIILQESYEQPLFEWNCQSEEKIYYSFKLKNKSAVLLDTVLLNNSLLLNAPLPVDYWEVHLTATNSYDFTAKLDSIWEAK
ncbi:hypothetical protein AGMMS49938_10720 [Fibrobacterales bacterium]|nr:hypothetical protein AGMMS49938_10720 [Fibrobacterales bacterium]